MNNLQLSFRKAQRKRSKLRLAICGPAGSGKTYSALLIAQGLGGKVAVVDSERGSAELYSEMATYDVAHLAPPYTPARYISLIKEAEKAGYDTLIIDSLSHAWASEGGALQMHDRATEADPRKNSYTAWRDVTPQHNALVDAMLGSNMHVIATMRSKTIYELVDDGKGKKKPIKLGMAPIQREGMDYEFTVVLDLGVEKHMATCSKDRTSLFDGQHWVPSSQTGKTLLEWLDSGADYITQDVDHTEQNSQADFTLENWLYEINECKDDETVVKWWKDNKTEVWKRPEGEQLIIKNALAARRRVFGVPDLETRLKARAENGKHEKVQQ